MNNTTETVRDIIVEMRYRANRPDFLAPSVLRDYASRLEDAIKREESSTGNAAKIREALVIIRDAATCGGSDFGNPAIRGLLDEMNVIRALASTALSEPPRNCDVGTAEEQERRFKRFCGHCKSTECELYDSKTNCELLWAQLPYEESEE